jgi:hypothetical protein
VIARLSRFAVTADVLLLALVIWAGLCVLIPVWLACAGAGYLIIDLALSALLSWRVTT